MSGATVTVVIANHDYGAYLPEAIDSALRQDAAVVVVDDGSTDPATLDVLDRLPDAVTLVRQANAGASAARNAGAALATTPYVIFLDADDRLAPGALATLQAALDADPALGFAYGHMEMFGTERGVLRFPPYAAYRLLYRHGIGLSALARAEVLRDTGGFDPAFRGFEDWELWLHALATGWRGRQVDAVTLQYRRHDGSKHGADRRAYRETFRALRAKHAALYARGAALAAEDGIGPAERAAHRLWWGPRPLPAAVERGLYRVAFAVMARARRA